MAAYTKNCMTDIIKNYEQNTGSDNVKNDGTFSHHCGLKG